MHLNLQILHIQVLSKVVWQVEPLQRLSSNRGRLTVGKKTQATKLPEFNKNGFLNHTPNHARIIPESHLKLPNSEPWYICKIRSELVFCEHKSFLCNHSPRATLRLLLLLRKIRQQHPAAASCNGTNMPTPKRTRHLTAAPSSSTLQRHHRPAPERTRHSNSCTLQQLQQQHPALAPLQHELGTLRTPLAAPSSITFAAAPAG